MKRIEGHLGIGRRGGFEGGIGGKVEEVERDIWRAGRKQEPTATTPCKHNLEELVCSFFSPTFFVLSRWNHQQLSPTLCPAASQALPFLIATQFYALPRVCACACVVHNSRVVLIR